MDEQIQAILDGKGSSQAAPATPDISSTIDSILTKGADMTPISADDLYSWKNMTASGEQGSILPKPSQVTQRYGNYNPSLEVFSGGVARDTNFATPADTPVALPPGHWEVVKTYNQAPAKGYPGNPANQGYGNAVMVRNPQTGEKLHFIHLSTVGVKPGDIVPGNQVIGTTGSSGNATGDNLGLEYYDGSGNMGDVLNSPYARYIQTQ